MSNRTKIIIDDAVSNVMLHGQERINLGAWANMERMLEGQNPYAKDEDKRKKRALFFWIGFLIVSALSSVLYFNSNSSSTSSKLVRNETPSGKSSSNTSYTGTVNANNLAEPSTTNTPKNEDQNIQNSLISTTQTSTKAHLSGNSKNRNILINEKEKNSTQSGAQHFKNDQQAVNSMATTVENEHTASIDKEVVKSETKPFMHKAKKSIKKKELIIKNVEKNTENKETKVENKIESGLTKNHVQQPEDIVLSEIVVKQNKFTGKEDTIDKAYITKKVHHPILSAEETNPRLINLSSEQELLVQNKIDVNQLAGSTPENRSVSITENHKEHYNKKISTELNAPAVNNKKELKQEKQNFSERVEHFKNATMGAFNLKVPTNLGFYAGINNNFNKGVSDVGGFHLGTNLMMRLKPNLYIVPSLLYSYKFNNALSINDYQISNPVQSAPTQVLRPDGSMGWEYHTSYDSTATVWNFSKLQTIEMPLMMQFEKGRMAYFGGINLAYGFKIKNELKTPVTINVDRVDTLSVANLSPRNAQNYGYSTNNFNSRYGVGYVVGASYYATPNLYLEARLNQNIWTNSKVTQTQNISSYFFTSPTLNLSIGYRLKAKEINKK